MRILLLLLLLLPAPLLAGVARVTSGEHDGFSRLVVSLPEPAEWSLGRLEDGYLLRIEGLVPEFDLSQVFRRIPKSRLAGIEVADAGSLKIVFACACHAEAFEFRPGIIVIDLKDGAAPADSRFEVPVQKAVVSDPDKEARPGAKDLQARVSAADALAVASMKKTVAAGIGAAASRGVVELSSPAIRRQIATPLTGLQADHVRVVPPGMIETRAGGEETAPTATPHCLDDSRLMLPDWNDAIPLAEQLALINSNLLAEFDQPEPAAVLLAARQQISLGFGAEAGQLIRRFAADEPDAPILLAMAALVDGAPVDAATFDGMGNCDSAVALWSVLARPELRSGQPVERGAIFLAFSELPPNLRRIFGPRLAERFMQNGDVEMVRKIRDVVARALTPYDPVARLVGTPLDVTHAPEAAEATYRDLAEERGEIEPAALIALVKLQLDRGGRLQPTQLQDLEILTRERKDQADGQDLQRAFSIALALEGLFERSLAEVAADDPAASTIWNLLADKAGSTDLLLLAAEPRLAPPDLTAGTAKKLAGRFVDLGLPELADSWLVRAGTAPDESEDALLLARIAGQRHDAAAMLRNVAGREGAEAERLRGEALLQRGLSAEAVGAFRRAGDQVKEQHALRLSQSWRAVAEQDAEPWSQAAAMALSPPSQVSAEKPLAAAQDLLEDSAAAREAVRALLATDGMNVDAP